MGVSSAKLHAKHLVQGIVGSKYNQTWHNGTDPMFVDWSTYENGHALRATRSWLMVIVPYLVVVLVVSSFPIVALTCFKGKDAKDSLTKERRDKSLYYQTNEVDDDTDMAYRLSVQRLYVQTQRSDSDCVAERSTSLRSAEDSLQSDHPGVDGENTSSALTDATALFARHQSLQVPAAARCACCEKILHVFCIRRPTFRPNGDAGELQSETSSTGSEENTCNVEEGSSSKSKHLYPTLVSMPNMKEKYNDFAQVAGAPPGARSSKRWSAPKRRRLQSQDERLVRQATDDITAIGYA